MNENIIAKQCTNGHYFDVEKYHYICPECGAPAVTSSSDAWQVTPKKGKGILGRLFGGKTPEENTSQGGGLSGFVNSGVSHSSQPSSNSQREEPERGPSQNPQEWHSKTECVFDHPVSEGGNYVDEGVTIPLDFEPVNQEKTPENVHPSNKSGGWTETIRKAAAGNEEKTMSFFGEKINQKTSASNVEVSGVFGSVRGEPVCGWIVAISGEHLGENFCVYAGKNSIGRNSNNRIVLARDGKVSRECHAIIVYEPKKRNFFVQPGNSNELTYLNGDYITESKQIKQGDVIELGGSSLFFVPLCGETFSWEEYIEKEHKKQ